MEKNTSFHTSASLVDSETDHIFYLNKRDTHLTLKLQLIKGKLFLAFKKEKAEHEAKSEDDSDQEPEIYLTYVNNLLHYLFSNCEVTKYNGLQRQWVISS